MATDMIPAPAGTRDAACWYAVFCKPRQEKVARENLLRQGYETYLPNFLSRKRRRGKWLDLCEPLFPRYLFIHLDVGVRSTAPVRSTRGAVGLVRFGGLPAIVPDGIIAAIRQHEEAATGLHPYAAPRLRQGTPVKLLEGPLAGMEGIFCEQDGEQRAIILLELLGKANRVAVHRDWIDAAD